MKKTHNAVVDRRDINFNDETADLLPRPSACCRENPRCSDDGKATKGEKIALQSIPFPHSFGDNLLNRVKDTRASSASRFRDTPRARLRETVLGSAGGGGLVGRAWGGRRFGTPLPAQPPLSALPLPPAPLSTTHPAPSLSLPPSLPRPLSQPPPTPHSQPFPTPPTPPILSAPSHPPPPTPPPLSPRPPLPQSQTNKRPSSEGSPERDAGGARSAPWTRRRRVEGVEDRSAFVGLRIPVDGCVSLPFFLLSPLSPSLFPLPLPIRSFLLFFLSLSSFALFLPSTLSYFLPVFSHFPSTPLPPPPLSLSFLPSLYSPLFLPRSLFPFRHPFSPSAFSSFLSFFFSSCPSSIPTPPSPSPLSSFSPSPLLLQFLSSLYIPPAPSHPLFPSHHFYLPVLSSPLTPTPYPSPSSLPLSPPSSLPLSPSPPLSCPPFPVHPHPYSLPPPSPFPFSTLTPSSAPSFSPSHPFPSLPPSLSPPPFPLFCPLFPPSLTPFSFPFLPSPLPLVPSTSPSRLPLPLSHPHPFLTRLSSLPLPLFLPFSPPPFLPPSSFPSLTLFPSLLSSLSLVPSASPLASPSHKGETAAFMSLYEYRLANFRETERS
ncbi:hypothetical protein C7M84_020282 [Penaeus vannamei]|uniref:Uncharacterized protein n=1 Tax=Penaeus vannamei TaxID=6689 RepID=A0A3R7PWQ0_PENVA|nr:hypothetical protein C7M84_020282 [Penaeus vannamei]